MKKYIKAVKWHLNMPKELRNRVINDFESDIASRLETGQSNEQIKKEFGSPRQAAAELNKQMEEYTYKKSPLRWGCFILMIFSFLLFLFRGLLGLLAFLFNSHLNHSIGIIGGADGPTAIFISAPEGYFVQQMVVAAILFIMGLLGYWALSHIKRK